MAFVSVLDMMTNQARPYLHGTTEPSVWGGLGP